MNQMRNIGSRPWRRTQGWDWDAGHGAEARTGSEAGNSRCEARARIARCGARAGVQDTRLGLVTHDMELGLGTHVMELGLRAQDVDPGPELGLEMQVQGTGHGTEARSR